MGNAEYYVNTIYTPGNGYKAEIYVLASQYSDSMVGDTTKLIKDTNTFAKDVFIPVTLADLTFCMNTATYYYQPKVYNLGTFYTWGDTTFYVKKDYGYKNFGEIDAWTCTALDIADIQEDPFNVIGDNWEPLQPHCSIEIIENEIITLTENDVVSIISDRISSEEVN